MGQHTRKSSYMFTNKSQSPKGIVSAALGCIDILFMVLVILFCFKAKGNATPRYAVVSMLALVFSSIGFVMGVMSRMEKDRFYLFPNIGIITNFLVVAFTIFMLILGVS